MLDVGLGEERTASMAFLTRSEVMRPLLARFLMRAALEEPEDIQAIAFSCNEASVRRFDAR